MVNEEVLGGIISGMERGESLKKSMMTLYTAGYKKEEIEEAAAMATQLGIKSQDIPLKVIPKKIESLEDKSETKEGINQSQVNPQTFASPAAPSNIPKPSNSMPSLTPTSTTRVTQTKVTQKVSNYSNNDSKEKMMIFLLIALLVFLVGVLAAIFIFREDLINFFSTFFS